MKTSRFLILALGAVAVLGAAAPSFGQDRFTDENNQHRLDRIEKDLREVRSIVLQAKDTGQPVEVRTAGDDALIAALQTRLDDLDQTVRGLNGQLETLTHQLDLATKDAAASHDLTAALADRIDKLEKQVTTLTAPPPPPPSAAAPAEGAADAGDTGNPTSANAAYVQARQLLLNGDYPAAGDAFQNFIGGYPNSSNIPAAHYWLGEVKYAQGDFTAAATNLIAAIHGWPQTAWAPDAMVKLSLSLLELKKGPEACGTLVEFGRHYPRATAAAKARAAAAKARAGCAA